MFLQIGGNGEKEFERWQKNGKKLSKSNSTEELENYSFYPEVFQITEEIAILCGASQKRKF